MAKIGLGITLFILFAVPTILGQVMRPTVYDWCRSWIFAYLGLADICVAGAAVSAVGFIIFAALLGGVLILEGVREMRQGGKR